MTATTVFRREFIDALSLLAQACEEASAKGYPRPILVGGGAVELYTRSNFVSGDFDLVMEEHKIFEEILIPYGFRREDRPGWLLIGMYHPDLDLGVQFVSGRLFDGNSDEQRVLIYAIRRKFASRLLGNAFGLLKDICRLPLQRLRARPRARVIFQNISSASFATAWCSIALPNVANPISISR